jgi:hypothetical protein
MIDYNKGSWSTLPLADWQHIQKLVFKTEANNNIHM